MVTSIPYHVEINRVIELLASQIYQSPLALLRENCQNAYDAILQKRWEDPPFDNPLISVAIFPSQVSIADNGVGMSPKIWTRTIGGQGLAERITHRLLQLGWSVLSELGRWLTLAWRPR